jgi:Secretion system C-terminal sorting domain
MKKNLLFLSMFFAVCVQANAQTIRYVSPTDAGLANGSSWSNASSNLQNIINMSNAGDAIWVKAGVYTPTASPNRTIAYVMIYGVAIYGGFAGDETLLSQRNIIGNPTILSGNIGAVNDSTDNCYHVIENYDNFLDSTAILDGFTISGGYADSSLKRFGAGAGMYNYKASPAIRNIIFRDNATDGFSIGAGVYNDNCSPIFSNISFINNTANNGYGGGMANDNFASPQLNNVTFRNNKATAGYGGAILNSTYSSPYLNKVNFYNNSARGGGAIQNRLYSKPQIVNCFFSNNDAFANSGGAIANETSQNSVTIINSIFYNNTTVDKGGAVYNGLQDTTTIINCTFWGNSAQTAGGGAYTEATAKTKTTNCIFWNNYGGDLFAEAGAIDSVTYSITEDGFVGVGNNDADPVFVNANNPAGADGIIGTADDGLRLQACSQGINTGRDSAVTANNITTDFSGAPRIFITAVDMGAYEYQSNTSAIAPSYEIDSKFVFGTVNFANPCPILQLVPSGVQPIFENTTEAKVWIEPTQPAQFVKRHYEITPSNNPNTVTATITLYFTQQEFTDFNAVNIVKLPINAADVANNKANLLIEKRSGSSNNGTGLPGTYTGAISTINPDDSNIIWNAAFNRWEVTFDVAGFSGFFVKTQLFTIPLTLVNFTAQKEKQSVLLQWQTAQEINTNHFEIERSADAFNFKKIGTLSAKGNTAGYTNYNFTDANLIDGNNYYRLKMADKNGEFTFSPVRLLKFDAANNLSIYPNPTSKILTIQLHTLQSAGNEALQITNSIGQVILQRPVTNNMTINVESFAPGIYHVRLGSHRKGVRFIKE